MNAIYKVTAIQISDNLDLKRFKKEFIGNLIFFDSTELLYKSEKGQYFHLFSYGVVAFLGYGELEMTEFGKLVTGYCRDSLSETISEDFIIKIGSRDVFGYNEVEISRFDDEVARIIMINVAQSVALDYYTAESEQLLDDTKELTLQLENTGRFKISSNKLRRFIGKSMNLKNRITENLYILDSPSETWEDEYLGKIDEGLKKTFDERIRYRSISENIEIIKENLDLFKDLIQHSKSAMTEWIIIILILIEVINLFVSKFH